MLVMMLVACGSQAPTRATEPDPKATEAVVNAVCDLVKGAGHKCTVRTRQAVIDDDQVIGVEVFLDDVEDTLGQITVAGRTQVGVRGQQIVSRFDMVGWGEEEAYKRGVHLWAVLTGAPIVDWALSSEPRPALRALYRGQKGWFPIPPAEVGSFRALEGWTLLQGVHAPIDHPRVAASLAGAVGGLDASQPHLVELRASGDVGEQVFTCHVDGEPAPGVCTAAKAAPWPAGVGWELRQSYLLVPPDTAPEVPIPPPEAPEAPAGE